MSGMTPLFWQWMVLKMLASWRHGMTAAELADETGVSQKTIRRDLKKFQQLGFPPEELQPKDMEHLGFLARATNEFHICRSDRLLPRPTLPRTAGWHTLLAGRSKRFRSSLSDSVIDFLERMADKFYHTRCGPGDYSHKEELITS